MASDIRKPMGVLFLFVAIITVNSGLMYQVINPAFEHLTFLTGWYWAVPYIIGETLYYAKNPVSMFGVLCGDIIGLGVTAAALPGAQIAVIALCVVCVTLSILPPPALSPRIRSRPIFPAFMPNMPSPPAPS